MAIPASVIPAGNSYSVNVAGPAPSAEGFDALTLAAASAAALLKIHDVDVRRHLTGDDPAARAHRDFLARAGAKASGFSPALSPEVPGEGFWKTTLAVVPAYGPKNQEDQEEQEEGEGQGDFWWPPRADKKVEWEPLLVALYDGRRGLRGLSVEQLRAPDLWIVLSDDGDDWSNLDDWYEAGAVALLNPIGIAWESRSATFGNAWGSRLFKKPVALTELTFGCFAGGVIAGLIEELLGENAFDKGIVRADRDELEARPLHIAKAAEMGGAAARAAGSLSADESPERLLHKSGDLLGRVRAVLQSDNPAGPSKPWGSKGR